MRGKKKISFLRSPSFIIVSLILFVFSALSILLFESSNKKGDPRDFRKNIEKQVVLRVEKIKKKIEDDLRNRIGTFKNLSDSILSHRENVNKIIEKWIEENKDFECVLVWYKNQKWPIPFTKKNFWSRSEVRSLSSRDREILTGFLYPTAKMKSTDSGLKIGKLLSSELLGYPIISIYLPLRDNQISAIEGKLNLKYMQLILNEISEESESLRLTDSSRNLIFTKGDIDKPKNEKLQTNRTIWNNNSIYELVRIDPVSWDLYYQKKVDFSKLIGKGFFPINYIAIFLIIILTAYILTIIFEKPVAVVSQRLVDVARGNFNEEVVSVKNNYLNKIVQLFNYMAKEMKRIRGLDVGEIISEKNRTETILRNIADGVIVTDIQNRIVLMNRVAEKWLGISETSVKEQPISKFIKNEPLISLLQQVKDGSPDSIIEFTFHPVGSVKECTFQAHAAPLYNKEDRIRGVVTVIRDITREKEIDQMKTELTSMVAHELKSPLTSIYGFSELLLDSNPSDKRYKDYARVILSESARLTDMVNKFLDLSRLESGRTEINMNPFDLRDIVEKVVNQFEGQARKKKIKIISEIPKSFPPANGDQDLIEQVLVNLISNAIKYSPNHSKIGIEAKVENDEIVVNVIDNGYGIPKESLQYIFDKFYRVKDSEVTEEEEGSGLGLALSKEIVEKHGGSIQVNSRLGIGSVFSFTIPLYRNNR